MSGDRDTFQMPGLFGLVSQYNKLNSTFLGKDKTSGEWVAKRNLIIPKSSEKLRQISNCCVLQLLYCPVWIFWKQRTLFFLKLQLTYVKSN